jgi:hypothetical protein
MSFDALPMGTGNTLTSRIRGYGSGDDTDGFTIWNGAVFVEITNTSPGALGAVVVFGETT